MSKPENLMFIHMTGSMCSEGVRLQCFNRICGNDSVPYIKLTFLELYPLLSSPQEQEIASVLLPNEEIPRLIGLLQKIADQANTKYRA